MWWILGGYLVASLLASLLFYAACVAAGRADNGTGKVSDE